MDSRNRKGFVAVRPRKGIGSSAEVKVRATDDVSIFFDEAQAAKSVSMEGAGSFEAGVLRLHRGERLNEGEA